MEIKNSFDIPLPAEDAWRVLLDIPRIAPCMPGAELVELIDKSTYKGKVSVWLGPVALTFAGTAHFVEVDEANHRARVKAQGTDSKGRGGAGGYDTCRGNGGRQSDTRRGAIRTRHGHHSERCC